MHRKDVYPLRWHLSPKSSQVYFIEYEANSAYT